MDPYMQTNMTSLFKPINLIQVSSMKVSLYCLLLFLSTAKFHCRHLHETMDEYNGISIGQAEITPIALGAEKGDFFHPRYSFSRYDISWK